MDCNINLGAHLVTPRGWYEHHGVYVGNGRVVHYAGLSTSFRRGPVEETSLESFAGEFGFRIEPHAAPAFSPEEIVLRARTRIGENRYRVFANNCEHFCEWCVAGRAKSTQVERLTGYPRQAARVAFRALDR